MPRKQSQPTDSGWASLLQAALANNCKLPPGTGWRTFDELWTETGIGRDRLYKTLQRLITKGLTEVFRGSRIGAVGQLTSCTWYRPIPT